MLKATVVLRWDFRSFSTIGIPPFVADMETGTHLRNSPPYLLMMGNNFFRRAGELGRAPFSKLFLSVVSVVSQSKNTWVKDSDAPGNGYMETVALTRSDGFAIMLIGEDTKGWSGMPMWSSG